MKYRPHDYQKYAIEYIISHPVSAVFLDCGLGKTSISLSAIKRLLEAGEIRKVLVVAPLRVATVSWPDELEGWIDFRSLSYSVVTGTAKERTEALKRDVSIYIINRENLQWLVEKSGVPFSYEMVVLDELSSFKNWNSKRFKAFMKVRPFVKRVVGLTGTPSSGGLIDLFAEFKCLDMGRRLGRFITQYRTAFFRPGRSNGNIVYEYIPLPDAEERIYEKISDITISMKAMDHLDMPELITSRCIVRMSDKERQLYEKMKKELVIPLDGDVITAANAAALSGKLSQMANGCVYSDDGTESVIHDRKLDALSELIEAANGKPVLVAYWYRHDLKRIKERLKKEKTDFAVIDSEDSIRAWNKGEITVGLMHPLSLGHGTNIQSGGSFLIWMSTPWSLELYQQTVARLWRQGQKSKTVVVQHIVTEGTVDEDILKALEKKDMTQAALIDAVKAQIGDLHE